MEMLKTFRSDQSRKATPDYRDQLDYEQLVNAKDVAAKANLNALYGGLLLDVIERSPTNVGRELKERSSYKHQHGWGQELSRHLMRFVPTYPAHIPRSRMKVYFYNGFLYSSEVMTNKPRPFYNGGFNLQVSRDLIPIQTYETLPEDVGIVSDVEISYEFSNQPKEDIRLSRLGDLEHEDDPYKLASGRIEGPFTYLRDRLAEDLTQTFTNPYRFISRVGELALQQQETRVELMS